MEPAGLAIGVIGLTSLFDSCLKLYEHVSNAKRYPEDCKRQVLFLDLEKSRFDLIRIEILQGASNTFDDGANLSAATNLQSEYLGRILSSVQGVLTEAQAIVEKYHNQKPDPKRKLRNFISSKLHTSQLSWIADDKNRLKELIESLRQLNGYIEQILPETSRQRLQLGFGAAVVLSADINRLREIQKEGYEDLEQSAAVRIAKLSINSAPVVSPPSSQDLRIHNPCIQQRRPLEGSFGVYSSALYETGSSGQPNRRGVLLERREAFATVDSIEAAERRLNHLVGAVQSMQLPSTKQSQANSTVASNPVGFGVPRCLGWIAPESSELDVIELVYEYPQDTTQRPVSLHMLLQRLQSSDRPSLGARFKLALRLAHYYASFISVGYFHKGLHSHNVFFFNDTLDPYIVGCAESRPEIISQHSSPLSDAIEDRELYVPWETVMAMEETDPSKRTRWTAATDIYGLGVMLVEIGRWSCASEAWNAASLYDFHRTILPCLVDELGYQMGDIYRTVVRACLTAGEFGAASELGVWQSYADKVLKPLESCRA
ncbi:uncharacterized protein LDX57_008472 [Aspergillus melleus]|uniref:uncharacterized protein n=1 Tax=Aspergillus melleus TaxID=138277 RepID=UPI001E8D8919|nr:uncharacterized protein LDX57_008472 [Aspergillus melleus]KAH8430810.1 hypothetical protein LDX57_008472 [Aspergillus melleus]